MKGDAIFSRKSDEWETPDDFFLKLDEEFHFNLDPCSSDENCKCEIHFTEQDDGLQKSWGGYRAFVNPPYSKISKWVEKSYYEGQKENTVVCMLIPSRTDTKWFHNFIYNRAEIRFVKGRLRFSGSKINAPFPAMVVIFRGPVREKRRRK